MDKTYVFDNNDGGCGYNGMMGLVASLCQQRGLDPNLVAALMNNNRGYEDAMREMRNGYHERRDNVTHYGAGGRILYRNDDDREMWDDEVEYRRRRDSRGRYTN